MLINKVAAVGAILNLIDDQGPEERERLKSVLSDSVALGAVRACLFDPTAASAECAET